MSKARRNMSRKRETQSEGIADKGNFILEILLDDGAPFGENAFKPFVNAYSIPFTEKQNAINFLRKVMREGFQASQANLGVEISYYPVSSIVRASVFNMDTLERLNAQEKALVAEQSQKVLDEAMEISDQVAIESLPESEYMQKLAKPETKPNIPAHFQGIIGDENLATNAAVDTVLKSNRKKKKVEVSGEEYTQVGSTEEAKSQYLNDINRATL